MSRKPISNKLRFEIFKRDNFTCQYCGEYAPNVILQIDHVIPVSKGGNNSIDNLKTACTKCNSGKHDVLLTERTNMKKKDRHTFPLRISLEFHALLVKAAKAEGKSIHQYILDLLEKDFIEKGIDRSSEAN